MQVSAWLNDWYGTFYNLIQQALTTPNSVTLDQFLGEMITVAYVLIPNITVLVLNAFFIALWTGAAMLFRQAAEVCVQFQQGSTSLLQRRLRIGYGRAARIIDQLHHAGVLGPPDGSKPREVMVDLIQLDQICPDD